MTALRGVISYALTAFVVSAAIVFVLQMAWMVPAEPERVVASGTRSAPVATPVGAVPADVASANRALADPDAFFAFARSQPGIDQLRAELIDALVVGPRQVLEIAVDHPPLRVDSNRTLEELAVAAVAERDIAEALAWLDSLPADDRQGRLRGAVAATWARQDPEAALAWAESLDPPAPGLVAMVIGHSAARDPDTALALLEAFELPPRIHPAVRSGAATEQAIARLIVRETAANADRVRLAEELLQRDTPRSLIVLEELTGYWAGIDAAAATEWVVQSAGRLPPDLPVTMVGRLAATDAVAAATFADRLPAGMRALVAEPVAHELARSDPVAAANWIAQFREQTDYRSLYMDVFRAAASLDPEHAAILLVSNPPAAEMVYDGGQPILLETTVAEAWAIRDEAGAAAWAQGIDDPETRAQAMVSVMRRWVNTDPGRAQQWVLGLPEGDARQRVIRFLMYEAALFGDYEADLELMREYGSVAEQQELIRNELTMDAEINDPRRMLRLAREWIDDPEIQAQAIAEIEEELNRYSTRQVPSN